MLIVAGVVDIVHDGATRMIIYTTLQSECQALKDQCWAFRARSNIKRLLGAFVRPLVLE